MLDCCQLPSMISCMIIFSSTTVTLCRPAICCSFTSRLLCGDHAAAMEPSFNIVFDAPLNTSRRRVDIADSKTIRARQTFTDYCKGAVSCCNNDCARQLLCRPKGLDGCLGWRRSWHSLTQDAQRHAVLENLRQSTVNAVPLHDADPMLEPSDEAVAAAIDLRGSGEDHNTPLARGTFKFKFLGVTMCRRGWQMNTGVGSHRLVAATLQLRRGMVTCKHSGFHRSSPTMYQLAGAMWALIESLREFMPLRDVDFDTVILPFHHKSFMFRMLQEWYVSRNADRTKPPLLEKPPQL